jgi:hypothetical protein
MSRKLITPPLTLSLSPRVEGIFYFGFLLVPYLIRGGNDEIARDNIIETSAQANSPSSFTPSEDGIYAARSGNAPYVPLNGLREGLFSYIHHALQIMVSVFDLVFQAVVCRGFGFYFYVVFYGVESFAGRFRA